MKKSVQLLTLLGLVILLSPTILAIEITPNKETYQPEELFQAQVTGNFLSLTKDNVFIYKENKVHPEPTIKGITKQNNIYYFYSILPNEPGNFSFRIENAEYLERGKVKNEPINLPITTTLKEESDLYINPGFVIPNDDFSIKVKSLFGNTDLTATFELTGEEKTLPLTEQTEETLNFKLPQLPPQQSKITINDYEIPVFLIRKFDGLNSNLEFIPHIIGGTITPNNDYEFSVLIKNPTNQNLNNIVFTSDLTTTFAPESIGLLEPNQTAFINLTISVEEANNSISGAVTATTDGNNFLLPVEFFITNNNTEVVVVDAINNPTPSSDILSCSQLGSLCSNEKICSGDTVESTEGPCCIGICSEQKSGSSSTTVGIILLAILVIIIALIVWRAKRKKNKKSAEQILEEKQNRFKKRMKGEKVDGKLDNI